MDNAQPRPPLRESNSTTDIPFLSKPRLKLPPSSDIRSWSEADAYMKAVVSPSALSLLSVDKMNSTINDLIYEYFSSRHGIISSPSNDRKHHKPHAQAALSKVRREKNQMKKEYRNAIRNNTISKDAITAISKSFHQLVRRHNKLRKEVLQRDRMSAAKHAINQCARNFWKFADKLFSGDETSHVQPSFTKEIAHEYFSNTYKSTSTGDFNQPQWMHYIPPPNSPFHHSSITYDELVSTLKKCRSGSSPSPLVPSHTPS